MKNLFYIFIFLLLLALPLQGIADQESLSTRRALLFSYAKSISNQNSSEDVENWLNLETHIILLSNKSKLQQEALSLLDSVTNQFTGQKSGFEWASSARMKYLRLIQKINYPYQLEYFRGALEIGLAGLAHAYSIRFNLAEKGLAEGRELSDADYERLRITRQLISHFSDVAEEQVESTLKAKRAALEKISSSEAKQRSLSQTLIGRCRLKLLEFIH